LAEGLADPPSTAVPGTVGGDGGHGEEASVRRPRHSISRKTPPDNWKDLAMPTPGQVRLGLYDLHR